MIKNIIGIVKCQVKRNAEAVNKQISLRGAENGTKRREDENHA